MLNTIYIKSFEKTCNNTHAIKYLTDTSHTIQVVNSAFLNEFNLESKTQIHQHKYSELLNTDLAFFKTHSDQLTSDDKLVMETKQHHVYLYIIKNEHISKLYTVHKYPLIMNNVVNGVYTSMHPYSFPRIPDISFITYNLNHLCSKPLNKNYNLTNKQFLVLFFLIRQYSYTAISSWLSAYGHKMSVPRVNEHIANLKKIFHVNTQEELINKALLSGYYSQMPSGLLPEGSYLINDYIFQLTIIDSLTTTNCQPKFVSPISTTPFTNEVILRNHTDKSNQLLNQYINDLEILFKYTDLAICIINKEHEIVATTTKFELLKLELVQAFINSTNKSTKLLHITDDKQIFIVHSLHIFDYDNSIIGYHIEIAPYIMPSIPKITQEVFKNASLPNINGIEIYLTKKEIEILFFYLRNFWTQKISDTLSLMGMNTAPTTINKHLNNIKKKFNLTQKEQLIDYAIALCYHILPNNLTQVGTFNLDDTIIDTWCC